MPSTLVRPSPPRDAHAPRPRRQPPHAPRARRQAAWLALGFALAFAVPFVLADRLDIDRDLYYGLYAAAVAAFVAAWVRDSGFGRRELLRRWRWGVGLGAACAAVLVLVVLRTEDATDRPDGVRLAGAILWRGVVYGVTDGVLLSVFPILAVFAAFAGTSLRRGRAGTLAVGTLALAASLGITAVYHLGYSDFRSAKLRKPVAGDVVWSAPTLLTLSPLGAPIAHAGLHVSAVVHSYETDTFLPPHEGAQPSELSSALESTLARLVSGSEPIAPGAVGYVSRPGHTAMAAAGIADVARGTPMTTDARMRLESVSKIYTAAVVHQLAAEANLRLDDTVERWLPGLLPYGDRVTLAHLLTHRSGIVDDNAVTQRREDFLALIEDVDLRTDLERLRQEYLADRALEFSPLVWVRIAAALPPLFPPGTSYQYSNTGFLLLGLVASRVAGKPMAALAEERLFRPLGLTRTAWDPQGPITGAHARGYAVEEHGALTETTDWHGGKGADGAVVSDASETARFLRALMRGELFGSQQLAEMKSGAFWYGPDDAGCGADAYGHSGAGAGYKTDVLVSGDGEIVTVLLLNGRAGQRADDTASGAAAELFCTAYSEREEALR